MLVRKPTVYCRGERSLGRLSPVYISYENPVFYSIFFSVKKNCPAEGQYSLLCILRPIPGQFVRMGNMSYVYRSEGQGSRKAADKQFLTVYTREVISRAGVQEATRYVLARVCNTCQTLQK